MTKFTHLEIYSGQLAKSEVFSSIEIIELSDFALYFFNNSCKFSGMVFIPKEWCNWGSNILQNTEKHFDFSFIFDCFSQELKFS